MQLNKCIFAVMALVSSFTVTAESVSWGLADFPPFWDARGEAPPGGAFGEVLQLMVAALPGEHKYYHSNFNRVIHDMKDQQQVCMFGLLKTPSRDEFLHFSKPLLPIPTYGIVFKKRIFDKVRPFLLQPNKLSLRSLLNGRELLVGHIGGRSLGKEVDELLVDGRGLLWPTVMFLMNSENMSPLMTMLEKDRVDVVLGSSLEANFYGSKLGIAEELTFVELDEAEPLLAARFACPKSDWGQKVVTQIDQVLMREKFRQQAFELFLPYLLESSQSRFQQQADTLMETWYSANND